MCSEGQSNLSCLTVRLSSRMSPHLNRAIKESVKYFSVSKMVSTAYLEEEL